MTPLLIAYRSSFTLAVCATLGELDETNSHSFVKLNSQDPNSTTNVTLQVTMTDKDKQLWKVMDQAT